MRVARRTMASAWPGGTMAGGSREGRRTKERGVAAALSRDAVGGRSGSFKMGARLDESDTAGTGACLAETGGGGLEGFGAARVGAAGGRGLAARGPINSTPPRAGRGQTRHRPTTARPTGYTGAPR